MNHPIVLVGDYLTFVSVRDAVFYWPPDRDPLLPSVNSTVAPQLLYAEQTRIAPQLSVEPIVRTKGQL